MIKCRRKTPELDAIQFRGNFEEIEKFCGGDAEFRDGRLLVATSQGPLWASDNDFIVKVEDGTFVVYSKEMFEAAYVYVVIGIDLASGPDFKGWLEPIPDYPGWLDPHKI